MFLNLFILNIFLPFQAPGEVASESFNCKAIVNDGLIVQFKSPNEMTELAKSLPEASSINLDSETSVSTLITNIVGSKVFTSSKAFSISRPEISKGELNGESCYPAPRSPEFEADEIKSGLNRTYLLKIDPKVAKRKEAKCAFLRDHVIKLESHSFVKFAQVNKRIKISTNDRFLGTSGSWNQLYRDLWGLDMIKARAAWVKTEGNDVVVAVVDTGVDYNHPDLWDNIWVSPQVPDRNRDGRRTLDDLDLDGNRFIDLNEIPTGAIGVNTVTAEGENFSDPLIQWT
jgi:subtilisin family serine protease